MRSLNTVVVDLERYHAARKLARRQACDDGIWFVAKTAPEAYLQQQLRRLHAVIEGDEAALRAMALDDAASDPEGGMGGDD